MSDPLLETPLFEWHREHGARLVDFGGWSMPVQYTTISEEHQAVRQRGLFDVSHMGRLTFDGAGALEWLERATTNHVARLAENQIQYSLMANDQGGVIDDVLVYRQPFAYLMVCNASNRQRVLNRLDSLRSSAAGNFHDRTLDTAMIAVQGPRALEIVQPLFDQPLKSVPYYYLTMGQLLKNKPAVVSRTGYTGEDGVELIVGKGSAREVWETLMESGRPHGIAACGLGARDTLRLEAAMPLYGHELTDDIDPYTAGLRWAVKLQKGEFAGRKVLEGLEQKPHRVRVGLTLEGKRIARQGALVFQGDRLVGVVTSGTFSPTLQVSLAMALVEPEASLGTSPLVVDVRGHREGARVVKLPFFRRPRAAKTAVG